MHVIDPDEEVNVILVLDVVNRVGIEKQRFWFLT
jgi:hypothetical protein